MSLEGAGYKLLENFVETKCPWCGKESLTFETYSDIFGPKEILIEGLEHYVCSNNCLNDYETPRQRRDRSDKTHAAYDKLKDA
jgi:hypothetical protein